jgi:DNA-binding NtrC family response regulator
MIAQNEINSSFYAMRLLSHRLDLSQIEISEGDEYPATEFTKDEQARALEILHDIERSADASFRTLSREEVELQLETLANRIEELANRELSEAGYDLEGDDIPVGGSPSEPTFISQGVAAYREAERLDRIFFDHQLLTNRVLLAQSVSARTVPLLIKGEPGTGKSTLARAAHEASSRRVKSFVSLQCRDLDESLIEKQFNSFMEDWSVGTLFLDNIDSLSSPAQARLIRCIQHLAVPHDNQEAPSLVIPDGLRSTVWVVFSVSLSHNDYDSIQSFYLKESPYQKAPIVAVTIPPLRERRDEIIVLAEHFVKEYSISNNLSVFGISPEASLKLVDYEWPGNLEELKSVIQRAVLMTSSRWVRVGDLPENLLQSTKHSASLSSTLADIEIRMIVNALMQTGSIRKAAHRLGLSRSTLYSRIRKYGLRVKLEKRDSS